MQPAKRRVSRFIIGAICASAFLISCSPSASYRFLSFFFDGVPNQEMTAAIADTINETHNDSLSPLLSSNKTYNLHAPYLKRACQTCHDHDNYGRIIMPMPELCYSCHTNLADNPESSHEPVAEGNCSICHDPHSSINKSLLIKPIPDLCLFCHLPPTESDKVYHYEALAGERSCISCHNPHRYVEVNN